MITFREMVSAPVAEIAQLSEAGPCCVAGIAWSFGFSWMFVPVLAAAGVLGAEPELPPEGAPGPFSLSDAEVATGLLDAAGLVGVGVVPVTGVRLIPASDPRAEIETLVAMGPLGDAWAGAEDAARDAVVDAVVAAMGEYRTDAGWMLPGSAMVIGGTAP